MPVGSTIEICGRNIDTIYAKRPVSLLIESSRSPFQVATAETVIFACHERSCAQLAMLQNVTMEYGAPVYLIMNKYAPLKH